LVGDPKDHGFRVWRRPVIAKEQSFNRSGGNDCLAGTCWRGKDYSLILASLASVTPGKAKMRQCLFDSDSLELF
jgi:hypothetical protein